MTRAELLENYITSATEPTIWGVNDCTMWAADWVRLVSGRDLATVAYSSESEARALIECRGGLLNIWDTALASAGFFESHAPQIGDVGLVETRLSGPVGVIFTNGVLALRRKHEGGVWTFSTARRALIKAWTI